MVRGILSDSCQQGDGVSCSALGNLYQRGRGPSAGSSPRTRSVPVSVRCRVAARLRASRRDLSLWRRHSGHLWESERDPRKSLHTLRDPPSCFNGRCTCRDMAHGKMRNAPRRISAKAALPVFAPPAARSNNNRKPSLLPLLPVYSSQSPCTLTNGVSPSSKD
jgi:hypothetical protein